METRSSFCRICDLSIEQDDPLHNDSHIHRFNFLLFEWDNYRKALVKNRHGIEVNVKIQNDANFPFNYQTQHNSGTHILRILPEDLVSQENKILFKCQIKNCRRNSSVMITSAKILHPYPLFSLNDPNNNLELGRYLELEAGAEYTVIVKFSSPSNISINHYRIPLSITFQTTDATPIPFTIARSIEVSVQEEIEELEQLINSPFTSKDWPSTIQILPPSKFQQYPDSFLIPPDYLILFQYGLMEFRGMTEMHSKFLRDLRNKMSPGYVTVENYRDFWHITLWLEEVGQLIGLQRYNMENVHLTLLDGKMLELEVPGLAEKRPSVIVGDMIDMKVHGDENRGYRGVIKRVNDKTVHIDFVDAELLDYLSLVPDVEMDVKFVLGRLPLERQHLGVEQVFLNGLVPTLFAQVRPIGSRPIEQHSIRRFFNTTIERNEEQRTAVTKIVNGSSLQMPYIVFGPPGTGKTVTIVEAILQIKELTSKKILVCAPANAACDMLTEKLLPYCRKDELIRICSDNVETSTMHRNVLQYSNYQDTGIFDKITYVEMKKFRIIITTLILIGRYSRKYHPDVIFIDEAAQPAEPEADVGIAMIDIGKQIILAGDPKQLGPSTGSKVAEAYGLGKSLLERLMNLDPYKNNDPNYITMLKQNFRSHETILKIPNELFYGGQLRALSAVARNDPLTKISVYRYTQDGINKNISQSYKKGHSVEFCSVIAKEYRQGRSPSYFNPREVDMVLKYIKALMAIRFPDESDNVTQKQIGVVTPYARQVYQVKNRLKNNALESIEVGTTETFQGREKRIIIITTVRAQKDLLLYDKKYNLGFVKHDKRFNVALTRAMSKLIVIGCPHVLGTDKKWLQYIELCERLGTYFGAPFARRDRDTINDITKRFSNIQMIDGHHRR